MFLVEFCQRCATLDIIVEAPIPYYYHVDLIRLGLNFNQAGIDSAMTHVVVVSAKVRRNEHLK